MAPTINTATVTIITATIMTRVRSTIRPRKAGEGDHAKRGGGGVGEEDSPHSSTPPPPCSARYPSPVPLRSTGADDVLDSAALFRLMAWLSPAYPVGAFSYSGGIEWAVEAGDITNAQTLRAWLEVMLSDGGGFSDAAFFVHAHRAVAAHDDTALHGVAELAAAFVPSKERFLETTAQGRAFLEVTRAAWSSAVLTRFADTWNGPVALPIAVGVACAGHSIACEAALHAFLHALAANWISAGVRLIPLGQTDGQRVLAGLEATISDTAKRALATPLDEVGTCALRADIASMRHETQYTRLFRS
jgi:urease accessory protein